MISINLFCCQENPDKHMDEWERFNETSFPKKE